MKRYWPVLIALLYLLPASAQVPGAAIDVQHYTFNLVLNDENNLISGKAGIKVKALKYADAIQFDLVKKDQSGKGMEVVSVYIGDKKLRFEHEGEILKLYSTVKQNSTYTYTINYRGIPADGLIISTNKYHNRTFFGDNWLKRAHNWLPCIDDVADKAGVDFVVIAPAHYQVVANGLKLKEAITGKTRLTHWSETVPISTKLMVIGAADFAVDTAGIVDGIPVYSYIFRQDKDAGFKSYACAKEILAFYINKIGPYAYKKLANVQSKTVWGGMENASAIFYYENSVNDNEIEALVAHEIAHQWFGDAATEKTYKDVWLSEGFATFLTNYYHEHKYGTDSLNKRLLADKKKIFAFEEKRQTPVVDTTHNKDYGDILNANSYQKAAWVLHMLRRKLGDTTFWKGIKSYYTQYKNSNAGTQDFITVMEKTSGQNLQQFFKQWLYTPLHPKLKVTFDTKKVSGKLLVTVEQMQNTLYELPLEYQVNGKTFTADIKDKTTNIEIPLPVNSLSFDAGVNSLSEMISDNPEYRIKE